MLKELAKRLAEWLFGKYEINRIYLLDLSDRGNDSAFPEGYDLRAFSSSDLVAASPEPEIRGRAWFAGEDAYVFGLWEDDVLVCISVFWTHRRFSDRDIVTLRERDAIMVDLVTATRCRGRGYAPIVIRYAEGELKRAGFERLYTWVWHSNEPSRRAFEKAGWVPVSFVAKVTPIGCRKPLRFEWRYYHRR